MRYFVLFLVLFSQEVQELSAQTPTPTPVSGLIPRGGAPYSVLKKNSYTDYDSSWYPSEIFDVRDYGADGTGNSSNDTYAFQQVITALNSSSGGRIHIPAGKYSINAVLPTITVPASITGDGISVTNVNFEATTINGVYSSPQGYGFTVDHSSKTTGRQCFSISGMSLVNKAGVAVGAGIQYSSSTSTTDLNPPYLISDVSLTGWRWGVNIANPVSPSGGTIRHVTIIGNPSSRATTGGIQLKGAEGTTSIDNINIYQCFIAINFTGANEGVYINHFTIAGCSNGIQAVTGLSGFSNEFVITNGWISIDSAVGANAGGCINIGTSANQVGYVKIGNVDFESQASPVPLMIQLNSTNGIVFECNTHAGGSTTFGNGIVLQAPSSRISVHDCNLAGVSGTALWLQSGTSFCNVHDIIYQANGSNVLNQGTSNLIK